MSTRAQIRFATREDGVSFSEHPDKINAQFYVHSDGYPEGHPVNLARFLNEFNIAFFILFTNSYFSILFFYYSFFY